MPLTPKQRQQFDTVCERIAEGESLVSITKDADMPAYSTVTKWLREDGDGALVAKYARAREDQADYHADAIVEIADSAEDANIARLRVDARKWVASKLRPKVYGDKVQHGGDESGPPIRLEVSWGE